MSLSHNYNTVDSFPGYCVKSTFIAGNINTQTFAILSNMTGEFDKCRVTCESIFENVDNQML